MATDSDIQFDPSKLGSNRKWWPKEWSQYQCERAKRACEYMRRASEFCQQGDYDTAMHCIERAEQYVFFYEVPASYFFKHDRAPRNTWNLFCDRMERWALGCIVALRDAMEDRE
jgi:hypothetical protein